MLPNFKTMSASIGESKKENWELLTELFYKLDATRMKKSGYLRTLINEYANMPDFKRERVLYRLEYNTANDAIENQKLLTLYFDDQKITLYPLALEYTYIGGGWYIIGIDHKNQNALRSIPLRFAKSLFSNSYQTFPVFSEDVLEKTRQFADSGDFAQHTFFLLGGN